jgi:hypothetical protein
MLGIWRRPQRMTQTARRRAGTQTQALRHTHGCLTGKEQTLHIGTNGGMGFSSDDEGLEHATGNGSIDEPALSLPTSVDFQRRS